MPKLFVHHIIEPLILLQHNRKEANHKTISVFVMFGRRILSSFVLASSIVLSVRSRAIPENASSPTTCKYDVSAPVTAWLGESCHLDPMNSRQHLPDSEQGVSCHALQQNRKCFPIWQDGDESSELNHESRDATSYKARPIRQIPEQQTLAVGARSISLQWPEKMQHAVFFTDKECHGAGVGRPEFTCKKPSSATCLRSFFPSIPIYDLMCQVTA